MEKLIKLLNEYSSLNWLYYLEGMFFHDVEKDVPHLHYTVIISKEYGFIKWLVDNNKIDTRKIDEDRLETIQYSEKERITIYDWLLMLLAIKENPISFLTSILKSEENRKKELEELVDRNIDVAKRLADK